eukprot:GCRY01001961.1.p1 GENE.GCRY01001961.1~~GCRY01001961.1.p1  ORF type:complete len:169 (-),score=18.87 GCRY01001961.1:39-494(-)
MSGQQIDVNKLSLPQLEQVRKQMEEEIGFLRDSHQQLKVAEARLLGNKEALGNLTPVNKDKKSLVPLTSSLYVPARLSNVETVTVDIGTGYYVKKTIPDVQEYYDRRIKHVKTNLKSVANSRDEKIKQLEILVSIMQNKARMEASKSAEKK